MSDSTLISSNTPIRSLSTDRRRWTTLMGQAFVGVATSFVYLTNIWIGPLNAAYGWDFATIALTFSLMPLVGIPASIIAGRFRDRFGSRLTLRVGAVGYAASIAISAIGANAWFFVIGMGVLSTFFMFFAYLAMMANVADLFPDRRGLALGIVVAATNLGGALIAPLAELLVRVMGVSASIAAQGIIYGAVMLLCSFLIVEAPKSYAPGVWLEPIVHSVEKDSTDTATIAQINRDLPWYRMLTSLSFWLFFACLTLVSIGPIGFSANMSLLAANNYGVDSAAGAWFYTLFAIGMGVGALIIGFFSDRFGPLTTIGVGSAVVAIVFAGLLFEGFTSTNVFLAVIAVAGVVFGGVQSVLPNVLMTAWGSVNFGVNFGLMGLSGALAGFIGGQLAVGADAQLFIMVGALTAVVGCGAAFLARGAINRKFRYKVIR